MNAVRNTFLETSEFIGSALKEECEKERMTASKLSKKISKDKNFCFRFVTIVIIFLFIDVERHGR